MTSERGITVLEYIILGFLMKEDMSGYDLKQWMAANTFYFFDASFGSIYPALSRMTEKGLIVCNDVVESNKFKKVYSITEDGKSYFMHWLQKPITFSRIKQNHLVNIFFYSYLPREIALNNLRAFVRRVDAYAISLQENKADFQEKQETAQVYYQFSIMLYGIGYYQFIAEWCRNLIDEIEQIKRQEEALTQEQQDT